ncbi:MAG: SUMF1/EgtB/PvdO family nonheme iron enzyme [Myxococcota bacterium]
MSTHDPRRLAKEVLRLEPGDFDVDRRRRPEPFPGPFPFSDEDGDAAVFFGRGRELAEFSQLLAGEPLPEGTLPIVLSGAAGVGKTSFVRAGLVPRLRRAPEWRVPPVLDLRSLSMAQSLELLETTRAHYQRHGVRTLQFLDLEEPRGHQMNRGALDSLLEPQPALQVILTVRPERLEILSLRTSRQIRLRPVPLFRLDEIAAGPAERYGRALEPELVDDLLEDTPSKDALTVFAFALRALWRRPHDAGLGPSYVEAGRLDGLVSAAVERALRAEADGSALAREIFVPALLDVDDDGSVLARPALRARFKSEAQSLLARFETEGLVRHDRQTDMVVPHEALFRQWSGLESWLGERRSRRASRPHPRAAALAWHRGGRRRDGLLHSARELMEAFGAEAPAPSPIEQDYLRHARERDARRRLRRRSLGAALGVAALLSPIFFLRQPLLSWARSTAWVDPYVAREFAPFALSGDAERALRSGATFRECASQCPEMVVVPAGEYLMGDEEERDPSMLPRTRIRIPRNFAVGRTEVTFDQFEACVQYGACGEVWDQDWRPVDGRKPVNFITRDSARAYVRWLSEVTGRPYRLLSSAEWEYAARAGTNTKYTWGDSLGAGRAHCLEACGSPWQRDTVTLVSGFWANSAPVASFPPNAFGLYDVHGNVWEVVEDCWHPTYANAPTDGSPWLSSHSGDCTRIVIRGGGAQAHPSSLRSCIREWVKYTTYEVGFRVARDLEGDLGWRGDVETPPP